MIKVKDVKQIRENFNLTHIVILGLDEKGDQHVATHGKTKTQSNEAAKMGDSLKKAIGWPENNCNSRPLERICKHCSIWQREYHRPGDVIKDNPGGDCMYNPEPVHRKSKDIACQNFEPIY